MITVFGEGRGFRVVWLLEEMGLAYRLRDVDLLKGVENDPEFLAINPGGFIPAIQDGDVTMVESIAILEYLTRRHGPTPLAPEVGDSTFPLYQQFLHLGEAGLMAPLYFFDAEYARGCFDSRLGLVRRQLARSSHIAGKTFTAADISVSYALQFARRNRNIELDDVTNAYFERMKARPAYERTLETCHMTKAWLSASAS